MGMHRSTDHSSIAWRIQQQVVCSCTVLAAKPNSSARILEKLMMPKSV